jgi:hypothetical protein
MRVKLVVFAPFCTFRMALKAYLTSLTPSTTTPLPGHCPPPIVGAHNSSWAAVTVSSFFEVNSRSFRLRLQHDVETPSLLLPKKSYMTSSPRAMSIYIPAWFRVKVNSCNVPLRGIWLCAMCHRVGFCYALWATTQSVTLYKKKLPALWPLRRTWFVLWATAQDLFCAMGNSTGFCYCCVPEFVICYEPLRGMCLCAMGHCTGFVSKPWAIAHNLNKKFHEKSCAMGYCAGFGYAPWAVAPDKLP